MRILMVNLPYAGHTNPTLPLTRELVRRGHEVTYVNALNFREKIEQTGAAFVPYLNFPDNLSEEAVKRSCFSAAFRTALSLPGPFDLLVYEMFFYPGIEIARRLGIPCLRQFSQPAWSEATWADAPVFFRLSARLIDMQMMTGREAREMGFGRSCLRDGILGSRPDLNLVYVPEAFQGHRDSFDGTYLFRVPVAEAGSPGQGKGQTEWATLPKPVVYISLGSIISNRGFYRECIRAFGNRPMSVILNTGKIPPETLGRIPENIHVFSFVPQTEVLACTDVFLTHCGMNSVNEALSLGVPMVAMPFINDQITNGKRMEELGLARRVRSFPSSGRELYRAVCEVCADPAYRQRALEMRETILQQGGWDDIIARLEGLVKAEKKPIL